jgi:hypothetical protein
MKKTILFLVMAVALTTQTLFAQVPSYVPTNGLVGYWPFSGNANDVSGNGFDGIVTGPTSSNDRYGMPNSAFRFDGVNDFITLPSTVNSQTTISFSVSLWLNSQTSASSFDGYEVISDRDLNSYNFRYRLTYGISNWVNNPNLIQSCTSSSGCGDVYISFPEVNVWNNYVVVYDGSSSTLRGYKDGVLIGSETNISFVAGNNRQINVGRVLSPQYQNGFCYVNGKIDDIGIWNRALTQEEITILYNANQCITNITVTDTLIINVGQLSFNDPVTWANNITIAPNPASSQININFNNITNLNGGTLKVINSLGQEVATTPITTSGTNSTMQLATWGGTGMYFVQIINPQGQIVDIKKIILQ